MASARFGDADERHGRFGGKRGLWGRRRLVVGAAARAARRKSQAFWGAATHLDDASGIGLVLASPGKESIREEEDKEEREGMTRGPF
jgi:hypothetical protein